MVQDIGEQVTTKQIYKYMRKLTYIQQASRQECLYEKHIFVFTAKTCLVGTQKNGLNEVALSSTKAHAQTGDQEDNYNVHSKCYLSGSMNKQNRKRDKMQNLKVVGIRGSLIPSADIEGTDQPVRSHIAELGLRHQHMC